MYTFNQISFMLYMKIAMDFTRHKFTTKVVSNIYLLLVYTLKHSGI